VQDGHDETKMVEAVRFCWRAQRAAADSHLRTAVDFLLSHNMLLCSEIRLGAELPDFFHDTAAERGAHAVSTP
jgi:hypothetical protein